MVVRSEPIGCPFSRPRRKGIYQLTRFFTRTEIPCSDPDTGEPSGYLVRYNWYVKDVRIDK